MGLEALVKGYTEGAQINQKRAKEMADKAADQWTQQFKLDQAKADAKQQEIENKHHQQEIDIQKATSERLSRVEERKAADDKAKQDIAAKALELRRYLGDKKITTEEQEKARAEFLKSYDKATLSMSPEAAFDTTQWAQSRFKDLLQPAPDHETEQGGVHPAILSLLHGGSQMLGGAPPAVAPQQGMQPGNNMLSGPAPTAMPASAGQLNPLQRAKIELEAGQAHAAQELAQTREQNRKIQQQNEQATKRVLDARASLSETQKKNLDQEIAIKARQAPLKEADLVAQIAERKARTAEIISKTSVDKDRETRLTIEGHLKANKDDRSAKSDLIKLSQKSRDQVTKMDEEVIKNVKAAASFDVAIADAQEEHNQAKVNSYIGMKAALANELGTLKDKRTAANEEYLKIMVLASENGAFIPRTADNRPDTKAAEANQRALEKARREAERKAGHSLPPAPVAPPGTRVGALATKPAAPNKKIEKKRGKVVYSEGGVTIREK